MKAKRVSVTFHPNAPLIIQCLIISVCWWCCTWTPVHNCHETWKNNRRREQDADWKRDARSRRNHITIVIANSSDRDNHVVKVRCCDSLKSRIAQLQISCSSMCCLFPANTNQMKHFLNYDTHCFGLYWFVCLSVGRALAWQKTQLESWNRGLSLRWWLEIDVKWKHIQKGNSKWVGEND